MRHEIDSNVPKWIWLPVGLFAAAIVGPAVLGMLASVAAMLAPLGVVVLPSLVWAFAAEDPAKLREKRRADRARRRARERRQTPVMRPAAPSPSG